MLPFTHVCIYTFMLPFTHIHTCIQEPFFNSHCNIIRASLNTEDKKIICRKNGQVKILDGRYHFFGCTP